MTDDGYGSTSQAVERAEHRNVARCDVPTNLNEQMTLARAIADSGVIPRHLRGKPSNVLSIMYGAKALDLPLWQAMQEMHDVDGKIGISANLMRALWCRAGHSFRVLEQSPERAVVRIHRLGEVEPVDVTYTIAEAKTAGLTGKSNWQKYPSDLLVARATSRGLRQVGADILLGFGYTVDELSSGDWDGAELDQAKSNVTEAAAAAAFSVDLAGLNDEIEGITDADLLRDLHRRAVAQGVIDSEHDGLSIRQRILNRAEAITAEADVVDAEVVEDQGAGQPEGSSPAPAPTGDQLIDCAKCEGEGKFEGAKCWICLGAGKVAA